MFKVILSFCIALFVLWLARGLWFNNRFISVNEGIDFWVKTGGFFVAAIGILAIVDSVFKTKGDTTKLSIILLFFVTVVRYYYSAPYYENGKPTIYVNSRTGNVYHTAWADIKHDDKTNRDYFLHPRSNDTCWNDTEENVNMVKLFNKKVSYVDPNVDYDPPMRTVVYTVEGSPYTFKLKAGETLNHWISFAAKNMHISLDAENYDYWMIYSSSEKYHSAPDVVPPDRDYARFYLKAGDRDQVIKMTLSYN
ncbi:hypothetical protein COT98_04310 [Candidatus Falkowbacteria bacterium CG10_big_fil_rev_8_21_14_0_10_39_9]|uniref:Uncharacterized protein n=1 Tax=Candidatus Falkowbacteria bacterium CG10_big_fil_rev_8_21_14_0_10_39_9 TaxID=1974566 RepID=A0A2M6WNG5_9BACT|nr:MAG: hypothetical protein COT98_04310 [Candidatus Falkowbacteria bacterium CG10_big_fil_rev_8_21_14_0_10_39_9]